MHTFIDRMLLHHEKMTVTKLRWTNS